MPLRNFVKLVAVCVLSLALISRCPAAVPGQVEGKRCAAPIQVLDDKFKPGQVWKVRGRPSEPNLTATVLLVESFGKVGTIVHIRLDNAVMHTCPGYPDWNSLQHTPLAKTALEQSVLELIRSDAQIPDYHEGYEIWLSHCGGVYTITAAEILALNEKTARANFGCN